jgi:hypothetical protein
VTLPACPFCHSEIAWQNTVPNPVYGIFATTVRYHNGALHIASFSAAAGIDGAVLWNTTDPYSDAGWGMPVS